jgi:hypothetical protein
MKTEAVFLFFLVVWDPSMNELWATCLGRSQLVHRTKSTASEITAVKSFISLVPQFCRQFLLLLGSETRTHLFENNVGVDAFALDLVGKADDGRFGDDVVIILNANEECRTANGKKTCSCFEARLKL